MKACTCSNRSSSSDIWCNEQNDTSITLPCAPTLLQVIASASALLIKAIENHNDHFSSEITIIAPVKAHANYSIKQHNLEWTIGLIKFLDML